MRKFTQLTKRLREEVAQLALDGPNGEQAAKVEATIVEMEDDHDELEGEYAAQGERD